MNEGPNLLTGSGALEGHGHGIGHARRCHDLLRTDWLDAARYIGVRDFSVQLVCCR